MLLERCITDSLRTKNTLEYRKAPEWDEIGNAQSSRVERGPKASILCPDLISQVNPVTASTPILKALPEIIKLWNPPVGIFQC